MMKDRYSSRAGVALIIVLGLVAILLIVSVTFSIHMRVERAGAANLRHAAVARQIVKGAMSAAIAAVDAEVGQDGGPMWYNTNNLASPIYTRRYTRNGRTTEPTYWRDTFASYDNGAAAEHIPANFFTPEVASYFPSGTAFKGFATTYLAPGTTTGGTGVNRSEWLPVYAGSGSRDVMGRYAFFALNTSGLLDASCVNRTNRWMGRDPAEIKVSEELFPGEILDAQGLSDNMVADGRYDSFAEFLALNERNKNPADNVITNCRSFTTFSYEPVSNKSVWIGGDAQSIREQRAAIIAAFYDCGLTAGRSFGAKDSEQARWAYLGLVDYVDGDDVMEDDAQIRPWQRPVTENVPVLSGFIAKLKVTWREKTVPDPENQGQWIKDTQKAKIRFDAEFKVPFTYPFVEFDMPQFQLEGKGTFYVMSLGLEDTVAISPYVPDIPGQQAIASGTTDGDGVPRDTSVMGLAVGSPDWLDVPYNGGRPWSLQHFGPNQQADPCSVWLMAAGQTKVNGNVQHRYPMSDAAYANPCSGNYKPQWMTVYYDFRKAGEDFGNARTRTETENGVTVDVWEKEVVVWAEIVDPRFASLDMAGESTTAFGQSRYVRVSHCGDEYNKNIHCFIPVSKIKSEGSHASLFSGFNAVKDNADMVADFKANGTDSHFFGGYFAGRSAQVGGQDCYAGGVSPLGAYILTHPSVAKDVYGMNMDGVRFASGESSATTDNARIKWRAHVKNAPLESVGELGYLPIGMWYTIRLYDYGNESRPSFGDDDNMRKMTQFNHLPIDDNPDAPPFHPVLDYFTLEKTSAPGKGRVNINSLHENVLASAFVGLPIGTENNSPACRWPGTTSYRVKVDDAKKMAKALIACRDDGVGGFVGQHSFENLSELGYFMCYGGNAGGSTTSSPLQGGTVTSYAIQAVAAAARGEGYGEFERESIVRNSCGLFTTRGQTFIIAVRGESYSPMFGKTSVEGGSVNAAKTAVGQIWRDSVPDQSGRHPIFVEFFKILDD